MHFGLVTLTAHSQKEDQKTRLQLQRVESFDRINKKAKMWVRLNVALKRGE